MSQPPPPSLPPSEDQDAPPATILIVDDDRLGSGRRVLRVDLRGVGPMDIGSSIVDGT